MMRAHNAPVRRVHLSTLALFALPLLGASAQDADAQRLTGQRSVFIGPRFDLWRFEEGLRQPVNDASDTVQLRSASQWSVPVTVVVPIGSRWSIDVAAAYASGDVSYREGAPSVSLAGFTDTRVRLTGAFAGDNVVLTLGVNAPTGKTSLDANELDALRVLGAPALATQVPTLGTGLGGTAGIVLARPMGAWAMAAGVSYEMRGKYSPLVLAGDVPAPDFSPSDVVHLSLGTSGLLGQHGMSLMLSADVFADDRLEFSGGTEAPRTRLGPVLSAEWELRLAAPGFSELAISVIDRYRMPYERGDVEVAKSSANYLDVTMQGAVPVGTGTSVLLAIGGRHHTGLDSDATLASAALASGLARLGLARDLGSGYSLQPFVMGQFGRIESGGSKANATSLAAGISLGRQF